MATALLRRLRGVKPPILDLKSRIAHEDSKAKQCFILPQNGKDVVVSRREIKEGLRSLNPEIPWTHLIDLDGIPTISARQDEKSYKKAKGLQQFGEIALQLCKVVSQGHTIVGKDILDLGCGEGGHSIMLASAGARKVTGIEGRDLAARRARFAAKILKASQVEFLNLDIHALNPEHLGKFDIVLCSGILHHIDYERWFDFLKMVGMMTIDTAIFYTHVANEQMAEDHKLKPHMHLPIIDENAKRGKYNFIKLLENVRMIFSWSAVNKNYEPDNNTFDGYIFQEHRENSLEEERILKMRASLTNTQSFWATEESLVSALRKVGFSIIFKTQWPHMFGTQRFRDTRQIIVAKKLPTGI